MGVLTRRELLIISSSSAAATINCPILSDAKSINRRRPRKSEIGGIESMRKKKNSTRKNKNDRENRASNQGKYRVFSIAVQ